VIALPVLEDEWLAGPSPLGVTDVALAVGGEMRPAGEGIGDAVHGSVAIADRPESRREADVLLDLVGRGDALEP
jgi:hypothetical protein